MNAPDHTCDVKNPFLKAAAEVLELNAGTLIHRITAFCIKNENGKVFEGWSHDIIRLMVAYHAAKKTLSYTLDPVGEVTSVVMWYRCNFEDDWGFVQSWQPDRADGDSIFLAFLFSENTAALKRLTLSLIWQEPDVLTKRLIGVRFRCGSGAQRVEYTPKLFNKLLKLKEDCYGKQ